VAPDSTVIMERSLGGRERELEAIDALLDDARTRGGAMLLALSQRPAALAAISEPPGPPAWKTLPSWYLVSGRDNTIGTDVERAMAKRIGAHTVEATRASHVVTMSRPGLTTRLIVRAARSVE
jgi:pimeloyl-ACP methyl ester carboxylesterase